MRRVFAFLLVLFALVGCGGSQLSDAEKLATVRARLNEPSSSGSSASGMRTVVLSVTGDERGSVSLTYTNETGGIEQKLKRLPWSETLKVKAGTFVSVSAQAQTTQTIRCEITSDGVTVQKAESSGQYVIASCSGSAK